MKKFIFTMFTAFSLLFLNEIEPLFAQQHSVKMQATLPSAYANLWRIKLTSNGPLPETGDTCQTGEIAMFTTIIFQCDSAGFWQPLGGIWSQNSAVDTVYLTDPYGESLGVAIGTDQKEFKLTLGNDGGIIAKGDYGSGQNLQTTGAGTRLIWYPKKGAFRAGTVQVTPGSPVPADLKDGTVWDDAYIGDYSTVAGGLNNKALQYASFVGAGMFNKAGEIYPGRAAVVSGYANAALGPMSFIGGGIYNKVTGGMSAIGGGGGMTETTGNTIAAFADYSFIGGGSQNFIGADPPTGTTHNFIGGGLHNTAFGNSSTVGGGRDNQAIGNATTIAGGVHNIASGTRAFIGGGFENVASADYDTVVVGGSKNTASGNKSFVGGGADNVASGSYSFVGGGATNRATNQAATITGGDNNLASGLYSFVGSGVTNVAGGDNAAIVSGTLNNNYGSNSSILGGSQNVIESNSAQSSILGGRSNQIDGNNSVAAGDNVHVLGNNSFGFGRSIRVLGDDTFAIAQFSSLSNITFNDTFVVLSDKTAIGDSDSLPGTLPAKLTVWRKTTDTDATAAYFKDVIQLEPRGEPPTTGAVGKIYADTSGAFCYHDGTKWHNLAPNGAACD